MTAEVATDSVVADLSQTPLVGANGAVWSHAGSQLNANLVKLDAGSSIGDHVNDEVEVLLVVSSGEGRVVIDGVASLLTPDTVASIPVGARRSIDATTRLLYFSIHRRRAQLDVVSR